VELLGQAKPGPVLRLAAVTPERPQARQASPRRSAGGSRLITKHGCTSVGWAKGGFFEAFALVALPSRRLSGGRLAHRAENEIPLEVSRTILLTAAGGATPSLQPAGCRRYEVRRKLWRL